VSGATHWSTVEQEDVVPVALKIDVMLANSVVEAADRARALEGAGVDGVFTFENSHDLFFPGRCSTPRAGATCGPS
jgi:2-methylisocitrate lyase-like PEP mutase family enzyme